MNDHPTRRVTIHVPIARHQDALDEIKGIAAQCGGTPTEDVEVEGFASFVFTTLESAFKFDRHIHELLHSPATAE